MRCADTAAGFWLLAILPGLALCMGAADSSGQSARSGLPSRCASAAPDGRTLYMAIASTFTALPQSQPDVPFKVTEFVPTGFVGEVPMAIATVPALPVNSLPELIAYSKGQSGGLNVAITRGGVPHMSTELFCRRSGADLTYVFYPGSSQAMSDVISGRVAIIVDGLGGPIAAGQLKLLAIASAERREQELWNPVVKQIGIAAQ